MAQPLLRKELTALRVQRLEAEKIMPPGNGKVPVVVLIHGSEHSSGIDTLFLQRIFPSQGIGAFVYDKHGTGRSGGVYTQGYNLLAAAGQKSQGR